MMSSNHKGREEKVSPINNETANTAAGINTPKNHEDSSPTDLMSEAVSEMMDKVQRTFDGRSEAP
ncbi:hypothetical protein [Paenibacillus xylaniclasticus]|uniref:hypothetical protein n=1 Tax=Paenibacillus xylaniclasticus TaxID=588083 RepID=UPI001FE45C8F|nr:hypothetical protein [Paenibacillus xylaniclasticus]